MSRFIGDVMKGWAVVRNQRVCTEMLPIGNRLMLSQTKSGIPNKWKPIPVIVTVYSRKKDKYE